METVQERLKYLRTEKLKMTQADFADKLGFKGASIVNQMESGSRSITERTIKEICNQFHVSKEWLWNGTGDIFTLSVSEPEPAYDLHGGYKPDPEKALGVERGTQQWKAFELLSKIYASADQQLIGAIFSNLKSFADAAEQKRENVELKRKVESLELKIDNLVVQLNQKGIIRLHERRSGVDRRQVYGRSPDGIEHRSGADRRRAYENGVEQKRAIRVIAAGEGDNGDQKKP